MMHLTGKGNRLGTLAVVLSSPAQLDAYGAGAVVFGSDDGKIRTLSCPPCTPQPGCAVSGGFCMGADHGLEYGWQHCGLAAAGFYLQL
jgi:hypothetical protein